MNKSATMEISDQFTQEGIQKLKKGMLLRFDYEGSINELIITKINRKSGKVYARYTTTYKESEVKDVKIVKAAD